MAHPLIGGCVLFACLSLPLAQDRNPQNPLDPPREAPAEQQEVMLTGCVAESTEVGTFLLKHAIARPDNTELPRMFRLVSAKQGVDFVLHVNHQVHATGHAEVAPAPDPVPGERLEPRELPALAVQTIQSVSERCLHATR